MPDRERLARRARAGALLFLVAFLGLSLGGYDPSDPPGHAAAAEGTLAVKNPCGPVGAALANAAFQAFGLAAFGLVWGLGVVAFALLRGHRIREPLLRAAGWLMVVSVASALIRRYGGSLHPCPPVGPGGYVGALADAFLQAQLGPAGMLLIVAAVGLIGLMLCQDALIAWPFAEVGRMLMPRRRPAAQPAAVADPRPGPSAMLESPAPIQPDRHPPACRRRGPRPRRPRHPHCRRGACSTPPRRFRRPPATARSTCLP